MVWDVLISLDRLGLGGCGNSGGHLAAQQAHSGDVPWLACRRMAETVLRRSGFIEEYTKMKQSQYRCLPGTNINGEWPLPGWRQCLPPLLLGGRWWCYPEVLRSRGWAKWYHRSSAVLNNPKGELEMRQNGAAMMRCELGLAAGEKFIVGH
jgi:hypothetical protein